MSNLQGFYDEAQETMDAEKKKNEKAMRELAEAKDAEVEEIKEERDNIKAEYDKFKTEFAQKMREVQVLELELEEKLAKLQAE